MSLIGRPPLGLKQPKQKADPDFLKEVRRLPCVICDAFGERQQSQTTAHHWIMDRGGNTKTPDQEAIPLCDGHHQGDFDTSKVAIHRAPAKWRELYGADHEYIEVTQDKIWKDK